MAILLLKEDAVMKKIDIALLAGLVIAIIVSNLSAFADKYSDIKSSVIRLHILANSDSESDQALKLKVRDEILKQTADLFDDNLSFDETEKRVAKNLDVFEEIARETILSNGYDYPVKCRLVNMEFNDRQYDDFTLPAGRYDALRIEIGDAHGHNWWCVMYPPLCLPAAEDIEQYSDIFTPDEIKMLKEPGRYKIKFKIVELIEKLKNFLEGKDKTIVLEK
jgi:stage II sporulation protein R